MPNSDALLHEEAEMTTEQRAREWVTTKIDGGMTVDELVAAAVEFVNDAVAEERLQCRLLAANYPARQTACRFMSPFEAAQQVASEIARAIGARDGS